MSTFLAIVAAAFVVFGIALYLFLKARHGAYKVFLGITWVSAIAFPVGAALHNAVDALFSVEEPVFFLLAVIGAPAGLVVGLAGTAVTAWLGRRASA